MEKQMNKIKINQQKSQKNFIPYVKRQNNKRKKTKKVMHKPFYHFFFVVPTLTCFLVSLECYLNILLFEFEMNIN